MSRWEKAIDLVFITAALGVVTALPYFTVVGLPEYAAIYRLLYLIPVVFAAFRFGAKGGVITPFIASLLYSPHLILFVGQIPSELIPEILDIVLFNAIGWVIGILAEGEARQKARYLAAARAQAVAREELQQRALTIARMNEELAQRMAEKGQLEEQVNRAEKLAALGQLVAGVAHEIRNPLGILRATAQVMQREYQADPNATEYIRVIKEEGDRMNRVVGDFLNFARPGRMDPQMILVSDVISDVVNLTSRYLREHNVTARVDSMTAEPPVLADGGGLKQALVNLIINSVQAMPHGGEVHISAMTHGHFLRVSVSDTGTGIPEETKDKIFDPFFTTKESGTGLGLAVVHRIVDAHSGFLEVDSKLGQGATISINLPLAPTVLSEEGDSGGDHPDR